MAQEDRIVQLEKCDCKMSCKSESGEKREDGDSWEENCSTCKCEKGVKLCHKNHCDLADCKNPEYPKDDKCCKKCLSEYFIYLFQYYT